MPCGGQYNFCRIGHEIICMDTMNVNQCTQRGMHHGGILDQSDDVEIKMIAGKKIFFKQ